MVESCCFQYFQVGISLDETVTVQDVNDILQIFDCKVPVQSVSRLS